MGRGDLGGGMDARAGERPARASHVDSEGRPLTLVERLVR